MGHGCRICQSVAVGTAVGVAASSGSSHPAVVNVRKTNSPLSYRGSKLLFPVSTHILHGRRPLLAAIHKEHTAGPAPRSSLPSCFNQAWSTLWYQDTVIPGKQRCTLSAAGNHQANRGSNRAAVNLLRVWQQVCD